MVDPLAAELSTVKDVLAHTVRQNEALARQNEEILALLRRRSRASRSGAGPAPPPPPLDEPYPLHVRLLFDVGNAYLASLMYDTRTAAGVWEVRLEYPHAVTVRVRKTAAMSTLVQTAHSLTAVDVIRVLALPDGSGGGGARKSRTLAGLFKRDVTADGTERRCPKQPRQWLGGELLPVTFDALERVCAVDNDADVLYALAATLFPPCDGASGAAHALAVGLMLPRTQESIADCLAALGVRAPTAAAFMQAALDAPHEAGAAARIASDARFAAAMAAPRGAIRNLRVRAFMDRARGWEPARVEPPCAFKPTAPDDATLPVLVRPAPQGTASLVRPSGAYKLRLASTGVYGTERRGGVARVFVRRNGTAPPVVVGFARNLVFYAGDDLPHGEDVASYTWYPPYLSTLADAFCTRLESAVFDGEMPWTDEELRRALGLAKRVCWAFKEPGGEAARALYARLGGLVGGLAPP
jgi:hypothetical protein